MPLVGAKPTTQCQHVFQKGTITHIESTLTVSFCLCAFATDVGAAALTVAAKAAYFAPTVGPFLAGALAGAATVLNMVSAVEQGNSLSVVYSHVAITTH